MTPGGLFSRNILDLVLVPASKSDGITTKILALKTFHDCKISTKLADLNFPKKYTSNINILFYFGFMTLGFPFVFQGKTIFRINLTCNIEGQVIKILHKQSIYGKPGGVVVTSLTITG